MNEEPIDDVDLTPKRLELVAEMVPQTKRIALLVNPSNAAEERVVEEVRTAAERQGLRSQ